MIRNRAPFLAALAAAGALAIVAPVACDLALSGGDGSGGLPTPTPGPGGPPSGSPTPSPTPTPTVGPTPSPTPTPTPGVPPVSCASDAECSNGVFCDGVERCVNTQCEAGTNPCPAPFEQCDEETQTCVATTGGCQSDADCNPGQTCDVNSGTCQQPLAINCGPGAGACNVGNFTPGCERQSCCDDVCVFFPECCAVSWDDMCAAAALTLSTCLANP